MTFQNSPFAFGDKVVAYCRYSEGDEQGLKNQSTEEQAAAIRQFCDQNGLELVRVFADPFASGRSVAKRDHYLEMLSYLLHKKKPDVQGVVLWDFERYGRNYDQAQLDAARLRMAGYKLFSLQQPITDNGPFAHVLEAMYFASAQNQSDMISADVKRALQNNFQKYKVIPRSCIPDGWIAVPVDMGVYTDGTPRTGYRAEPDPAMTDRIRQAVEARIKGEPIRVVKHILDAPFADHPEKVEKLFHKTLLYGSMTYGGTTIDNYCEPIIDKDTFDRLQVAHKTGKRKTRREGSGAYSANRAMLSGLLVCGVCGEHIYINRNRANGKTYETYCCSHKHSNFRRSLLEPCIVNAAIDLLTGDNYERLKAQFTEMPDDADDTDVIRELDDTNAKIDTLTEAITVAGASRALLMKLATLEAHRDDLEAILRRSEPRPYNFIADTADSLRDAILGVLRNEKSTTDDIRDALSIFISACIVYPDGRIVVRHSLLGNFGSEMSGDPTAPPEGVTIHSQNEAVYCL